MNLNDKINISERENAASCGYAWTSLTNDTGTKRLNARPHALPGDQPQYTPDRDVDITHIALSLVPDFNTQSFKATAALTVRSFIDDLREITFDATELKFEDVYLDTHDSKTANKKVDDAQQRQGGKLAFRVNPYTVTVSLDRPYRVGEIMTIVFNYSATPRKGLYFIKPDPAYPHLQPHLWTQGQDLDACYWLPCYNFPNDKATSELRATVPGNYFALSNGALVATTTNPDGTRTFHWQENMPHSAYLLTFVAGPFVEITDKWNDLPVTYYVLPGNEENARRAFHETPGMLDFFSKQFDFPYPYEKYAQVAVSNFIFGGMENTSATTLTDTVLPDEHAAQDYAATTLVAHELAHQWFGDLLTCREWSHGWLNEGFATYCEALWYENALGEDEYRYLLYRYAETYRYEDGHHYRRPIVERTYNEPIDIFDRHLYEKGSLVLHMLRYQLGDKLFWQSLRHYIQKFQQQNVITSDLERAIEEASGRSLTRFFDQWVYKGGFPEFDVAYEWNDRNMMAKITVKQTQTIDEITPVFVIPVDIAFTLSEKEVKTFRISIESLEQSYYFNLTAAPLAVRFDPGNWILKTLKFDRSFELLKYQLMHDKDVTGRIEAAKHLGILNDPENVAILGNALQSDKFWGVQSEIARTLGQIRTEGARDALLAAIDLEHPKARRAVVEALGEFRHDNKVAAAILPILRNGDRTNSYFVRGEAARSLGKLRIGESFEALEVALTIDSWQDTVRARVVDGLTALRDVRAVDRVLEMTRWGVHNSTRTIATNALGILGTNFPARRDDIIERLVELLHDPWLRVRNSAALSLGQIGEPRAIGDLHTFSVRELHGRPIRSAREAIIAINKHVSREDELNQMREEMAQLHEANRKLRERVEEIAPQGESRDKHREHH